VVLPINEAREAGSLASSLSNQTWRIKMKIGILNAGNIGRNLSKIWHGAGHKLFLAKAGEQQKLNEFLPDVPGAQSGTPAQAAEFGDVVLFSVYWPRFEETLAEVGDLDGKIVIDTMNALNVNEQFEHYHDLEFMKSNSTTEELQRRLPKARVVKAFSTMPFPLLENRAWENIETKPPIFLAGNDAEAKAVVRQLAQDAGFTAMDAGPAESARGIEQMGVVLHNVGTHEFKGDYARLAPTFLRAN